MIFLQDKDKPRQRLNTIEEKDNESDVSSEETGAPPVDETQEVEQMPSESSQQTASQPSEDNLVQMPPPVPKSPTPKRTKKSKKNDERLDKAFSILEASTSALQNEESELQIFGKLVAKKLQGYSPNVRSIAQEELMKVLFKADRGFYNQQTPPMQGYMGSGSQQNMNKQLIPTMQCPVESVSQPLYQYHYPATFNYSNSSNSNHPHPNPSNQNVTLCQTSRPAIPPDPQHSPAGNYFSKFTPNTQAGSTMSGDDDGRTYQTL